MLGLGKIFFPTSLRKGLEAKYHNYKVWVLKFDDQLYQRPSGGQQIHHRQLSRLFLMRSNITVRVCNVE